MIAFVLKDSTCEEESIVGNRGEFAFPVIVISKCHPFQDASAAQRVLERQWELIKRYVRHRRKQILRCLQHLIQISARRFASSFCLFLASSVDLQPHDSPGLTTSYHFPYPQQPPVPDKVLAPDLAAIIGLSAAIAAFDDRGPRLAPRPKPDL